MFLSIRRYNDSESILDILMIYRSVQQQLNSLSIDVKKIHDQNDIKLMLSLFFFAQYPSPVSIYVLSQVYHQVISLQLALFLMLIQVLCRVPFPVNYQAFVPSAIRRVSVLTILTSDLKVSHEMQKESKMISTKLLQHCIELAR